VVIGVAMGTVALFFARAPIRHMLYGVSVLDPATVAAAAALLAVVVVMGSFWPAWRAASVDPTRAMRAE
jgi:ABC-type antimicrobial peptide transport system permease subunit